MSKKGVTKPRNNRKKRFNAPIHLKRKHLAAPLSPELKSNHGTRTMCVRKDDTVTITKGDRKMTEGKVLSVDLKKWSIYIEGVTRNKMDGSSVQIPIKPENVMITRLSLDDSSRRKIIDRRGYEAKLKGL